MPKCQIVERDLSLKPSDLQASLLPGDVLLDAWPWPERADLHPPHAKGALFCCPFNGEVWGLNYATHTIVSRDPLTITPSFVCPDGCHFWIRDGEAVPA